MTMNQHNDDIDMPPVIPGDAASLQRAITLLGNRAAGPLTKKPRKQLIELVGVYPSSEKQAAKWKFALKTLVKGLKTI